jgi:hypothetical protein
VETTQNIGLRRIRAPPKTRLMRQPLAWVVVVKILKPSLRNENTQISFVHRITTNQGLAQVCTIGKYWPVSRQ